MRNFDENTITAAVIERLQGAKSQRVLQVSEALVRHLHDFVREIEPTFEEWQEGIRFLTEVGKKCSATRQEFILLSDTLGVSMLVDAINHRFASKATPTTVTGPFHIHESPEFVDGADMAKGAPGVPCFVRRTLYAWARCRHVSLGRLRPAPHPPWRSLASTLSPA